MSTHKIALITDSTSDIPPEIVRQYDIRVVPQILIWGTEELRDNVTITPEDFYKRLPNDPAHPTTSQPVPKDFLEFYEQAKRDGAEEIVAICISNQLSGTLDSARQAATMIDIPVHVVDSLSVSMGLGWQVIAAARAREAGGGVKEMIEAANRVRQTLHIYFSLDTLEYLHRGGRIGGAAKLIGTALQLKPMLTVDTKTGRVEAAERTRTRKKALQRIYEVFFEKMDTTKPMHITVLHGNAPQEAREFEERIRAEHKPAELLVVTISPVLGVHTGPGAVGIIGYYEQ